MTTVQTTTQDTPATYAVSDRDAELRAQYEQARAEAQAAFEQAQARVTALGAQLAAAREAQAQRLAAIASARAQAQAAATATLTAGDAEASADETSSDFIHWQQEQAAQRAAGALSGLESELQSAIAERTRLSTVWADADQRYQLQEREIASAALLAEWLALDAHAADLARRSRDFNAAGLALGQQRIARAGQPASAAAIRAAGGLCLPGRVLPSARRDLRASVAAGYVLRLAPDLTTVNVPDSRTVWTALDRAIEKGEPAE